MGLRGSRRRYSRRPLFQIGCVAGRIDVMAEHVTNRSGLRRSNTRRLGVLGVAGILAVLLCVSDANMSGSAFAAPTDMTGSAQAETLGESNAGTAADPEAGAEAGSETEADSAGGASTAEPDADSVAGADALGDASGVDSAADPESAATGTNSAEADATSADDASADATSANDARAATSEAGGDAPNEDGAESLEPADVGAQADRIPAKFIDMRSGQKFYREIDWMRTSGLSTGIKTPSGMAYMPKSNLSREAMAAFLYRAANVKNYTPPRTSPFVDVHTSHKFYREIAWMRTSGLSTGVKTANGREYQPKVRLSREAMAAFLYRSVKPKSFSPPKSSPFLDLRTNHKFYREITWLAHAGLTTGTCTPRGREFLAGSKLTREAMAAFMYRKVNNVKVSLGNCARPNISSPSSTTVVTNKKRPLAPRTWAPSDLRMPAYIPNTNGQPLRAEAALAVEQMYWTMMSEIGHGFYITSGYRSYAYQSQLFNAYVARDGVAAAERYSARPGYSEHQTGLAVDIDDGLGCAFESCFGTSTVGWWLRQNAHRFGFILRYDYGQESKVGFLYEPWHFRYVGTAISNDMKSRGYVNLETYFQLPAAPTY